MHYVTDVAAGVALASLAVFAAPRLNRLWGRQVGELLTGASDLGAGSAPRQARRHGAKLLQRLSMDPVPSKRDRDSRLLRVHAVDLSVLPKGDRRAHRPSRRPGVHAEEVLRARVLRCPHLVGRRLLRQVADLHQAGDVAPRFATKVEHGCPLDCGLCEDHLQHTCSPIFEINDKCDLTCPICIVRNQQRYSISFEDFKRGVDLLIEKEGELATMFLSGGEPTLHPQFFDFVDYILRGPHAGGVRRVLVSTHGRRIANDPAFAERFKASGAYASLQFDTLRPNVYPKLRGVELIDMKMKAIDVIRELDIPTVLVPTVSKGDNSDELGDLVNFGVELPQCSSIVIQPMAHTGDGGDGFTRPRLDIASRCPRSTN